MTNQNVCSRCGFLKIPENDPRWREWEEFREADMQFDHGEFSASKQDLFPPFCMCCHHGIDLRTSSGCEDCYVEMLTQEEV